MVDFTLTEEQQDIDDPNPAEEIQWRSATAGRRRRPRAVQVGDHRPVHQPVGGGAMAEVVQHQWPTQEDALDGRADQRADRRGDRHRYGAPRQDAGRRAEPGRSAQTGAEVAEQREGDQRHGDARRDPGAGRGDPDGNQGQ